MYPNTSENVKMDIVPYTNVDFDIVLAVFLHT
jgi:hypothetical protein